MSEESVAAADDDDESESGTGLSVFLSFFSPNSEHEVNDRSGCGLLGFLGLGLLSRLPGRCEAL